MSFQQRFRNPCFALAIALAPLAATSSAWAQYIAPHSNDPHPPANQPRYQLPSPLARPGVPGMPNAAHSNDPHYTKTLPTPAIPSTPPYATAPSGSMFPSVRSDQLRRYDYQTGRRPSRAERAGKKRVPKSVSLAQCYKKWDAALRVTRASWEANCRRLAKEGKVRG